MKQGTEAVHIFPRLQVERVELTSRKNSSSPTPTWSSYANAPRAILLAPTHFITTRSTHLSLWRRRRCSAFRPNTRVFPVCRVDDAPQHPWAPPPPPCLHPFPPPPTPHHPLHIACPSAPALKKRRACTQGAASVAEQDSSQESVFSASQLFHLLSPHSATSPQASDLGNNSDGTVIAASSSKGGSGAATRASALTRGQQQRTADVAAQEAFLG